MKRQRYASLQSKQSVKQIDIIAQGYRKYAATRPAPASMPMGDSVAAAAPVKPLGVVLGLEGVLVGLLPLPGPLPGEEVDWVPLLGGGGEPPVPEAVPVPEEVGQNVVVKVWVRVVEPVVITVVPVEVVVEEVVGEVGE